MILSFFIRLFLFCLFSVKMYENMTTLDLLKKEILNIALELQYVSKSEIEDFKFDVSFIDESNSHFGDVSVNISLILAKKLGRTSKEIGEEILKSINSNIASGKELSKMIQKAELAANGFINLFLKEEFLVSEVERVSNLKFIETKFTNKKVLVEHSSPNLFKPFHIGHLMNNTIGESIVRLMKHTNADLKTMSFPSDISIGIAKAIYILKIKKDWSFEDKDIIERLGNAYVEGVKFYDENEDKRIDIVEIAKNLFEKNKDSEDWKLFEMSREVNIKYFENTVGFLGSHFDHLIYESQAGKKGEEIVKENINLDSSKEVFEIGEGGAILYDTKRKKNNESDETIKSVFINSEGHPTYEAKDLGLLKLKKNYFNFDYNFFVTDNEQVPHFDVVLDAAKALGDKMNSEEWKNIAERSFHIPHGRLNLKGERMSSRLGNILSVENTLHLVNTKVAERISEKVSEMSDEEKEKLIKNISLSALKIAILKSKPGLNIDFDFETSLNFEGATGPYLLYTFSRANSILEKAGHAKYKKVDSNFVSENNLPLIKKIIQLEAVTKKAIEDIAPQLIVKYLFELAQAFNTFYAKEKIISEDKEHTEANIYLVEKFKHTLKFAMNMVGIEEVDRM